MSFSTRYSIFPILFLLIIIDISSGDLVLRRYRKPKEKGFVLGRHSSGFIDVPKDSYLIVAGAVNIGNFSYIKLHEDGALLVAIDANVDVGRYFSAYALEGALVLHKNATFYTGAWNQLRVTHNKTLRLEKEASVRAPSAFIYTYINDNLVVGSNAHVTLEQSSRFIVSSCSAGNFISCRFGTGSRVSVDVAGELSIGGAFRIHGTGNVMIGYHGLLHTAENSSVLMRPLTQLRLGQFSVLNLRPGASLVINVQGASLELGDHARLVIEDDVQCEIRGLITVDSSVSAGWVHGSGTSNSAFQCLKKGEKVRPRITDGGLQSSEVQQILDDPAATIIEQDYSDSEGSFERLHERVAQSAEQLHQPYEPTPTRNQHKTVSHLQPVAPQSNNADTGRNRHKTIGDLQPIPYQPTRRGNRLNTADLLPLDSPPTSSGRSFGIDDLQPIKRGRKLGTADLQPIKSSPKSAFGPSSLNQGPRRSVRRPPLTSPNVFNSALPRPISPQQTRPRQQQQTYPSPDPFAQFLQFPKRSFPSRQAVPSRQQLPTRQRPQGRQGYPAAKHGYAPPQQPSQLPSNIPNFGSFNIERLDSNDEPPRNVYTPPITAPRNYKTSDLEPISDNPFGNSWNAV